MSAEDGSKYVLGFSWPQHVQHVQCYQELNVLLQDGTQVSSEKEMCIRDRC